MMPQTKAMLKTICYLGLALSLLPAFLVFGDVVSRQTYVRLMVLGMVLWFGTASFWIKRDHLGN